jgi:integrase
VLEVLSTETVRYRFIVSYVKRRCHSEPQGIRGRIGKTWGDEITEKVVWHVVKQYAALTGISKLAPHDLRRSCARLCHIASGELEQIQFLLGHVSVQTTEKYLGCKQRLKNAVNDQIGIEPVK